MRVWDAPTRLFHWAVTLLVMVSYVSIRLGRVELHLLYFFFIVTLLM